MLLKPQTIIDLLLGIGIEPATRKRLAQQSGSSSWLCCLGGLCTTRWACSAGQKPEAATFDMILLSRPMSEAASERLFVCCS